MPACMPHEGPNVCEFCRRDSHGTYMPHEAPWHYDNRWLSAVVILVFSRCAWPMHIIKSNTKEIDSKQRFGSRDLSLSLSLFLCPLVKKQTETYFHTSNMHKFPRSYDETVLKLYCFTYLKYEDTASCVTVASTPRVENLGSLSPDSARRRSNYGRCHASSFP